MSFEKVPESLRSIPQWVCHKNKQPYDPRSGTKAKANAPSTWTDFYTCSEYARMFPDKYDGIGFEIQPLFVGVDLDHVVDPITGIIEPWAKAIVDKLDSYTEYSPSGTGLHIFVYGTLPDGGNKRIIDKEKRQAIEMYSKNRYFTVTGNVLKDLPVCERQAELEEVFYSLIAKKQDNPTETPPVRLNAPEYLRRGLEKDKLFCALYDGHRGTNDESGNDMALMNKLAYWCNGNVEQMIAAFRASPYAAQKDEEHLKKLQRDDYMLRTAQKAVQSLQSTAAADDEAYRQKRVQEAFTPESGKEIRPQDYTDAGNAAAFSEYFKDELLFSAALGWLRWNGKLWDNSDHHATACAIKFSKLMLDEAKQAYIKAAAKEAELKAAGAGETVTILDESGATTESKELTKAKGATKSAKNYLDWAKKTRSRPRIEAMIALSKPKLIIKAAELDPNPFDLNTPAGIIDLKTGQIRKHDPKALCTKITHYQPGNKGAERWDDFLQQVTDGDTEYQQYLQLLFGLAAVGKVYAEAVYMAYGPGGNGKSTLTNSVRGAMGDYGGSICVDILTVTQQNKGASLATLRGKRIVTTGEMDETQRLSPATLKRIASTDPITIEVKYKQPEDIVPTHTLILSTNYLPRVSSRDCGTWRRIKILPFLHTISEARNILNYADTLEQECGEAIVSWVIEGARQAIAQKFKISDPIRVTKATQKYRQEEDWLRNFLNECCDLSDPNARVPSPVLYEHYQRWAKSLNEFVRSQTKFSQALETEGFKKIKSYGRVCFEGIKAIGAYMGTYYDARQGG